MIHDVFVLRIRLNKYYSSTQKNIYADTVNLHLTGSKRM